MIYLCILSIVATGLSLSRYISRDPSVTNANVAVYDVFINSGEPSSANTNVSASVYATSKLTEPGSMIEGTYDKIRVNIINRSECSIGLSDVKLQDPDSSVYEKLIIPMDENELAEYERQCGSIPLAVIDYLGIDSALLDSMSVHDIDNAVSESNINTCNNMHDQIAAGERKTIYIISWVEHDNIYLVDAEANTNDNISHKTPTQLGVQSEDFNFCVHSEQID